jgi:hypothetical protein
MLKLTILIITIQFFLFLRLDVKSKPLFCMLDQSLKMREQNRFSYLIVYSTKPCHCERTAMREAQYDPVCLGIRSGSQQLTSGFSRCKHWDGSVLLCGQGCKNRGRAYLNIIDPLPYASQCENDRTIVFKYIVSLQMP